MNEKLEVWRKVKQECELTDNDFYYDDSTDYCLIKITGIAKIVKKYNIRQKIKIHAANEGYACVFGKFSITEFNESLIVHQIQTIGSASAITSPHNHYYAEMAEKRCKARGVLMLIGLYGYGYFGMEENPEESDNKLVVDSGIFKKLEYLVDNSTLPINDRLSLINEMESGSFSLVKVPKTITYLEANQLQDGVDVLGTKQKDAIKAMENKLERDKFNDK